MPKPVAISTGLAKRVDATARNLAEDYSMTNFNTPQRGRKAAISPTGNVVDFRLKGAPAWGGQFMLGANGEVGSMCVPTGVIGKMPAKNIIGRPQRLGKEGQSLGAASRVEGAWGSAADIAKAVERIK